MTSIAAMPAPLQQPTTATPPGKIARAAREFEALLLGSLLRSLEQGLATLPGDEASSSDPYQDFSTEALASGLAARGGLGIGAMVIRNLMKSNVLDGSTATKVSSLPSR
jgi:Rod binding domain-containing protein